jgi:hypothetical protein
MKAGGESSFFKRADNLLSLIVFGYSDDIPSHLVTEMDDMSCEARRIAESAIPDPVIAARVENVLQVSEDLVPLLIIRMAEDYRLLAEECDRLREELADIRRMDGERG